MRISILAEGSTERAFLPFLRNHIQRSLPTGSLPPRISVRSFDGGIATRDKLARNVQHWLRSGEDHVIVLTDIHGTEFSDASDAKAKIRQWVGNDPRVTPHVALRDFEAWLLPYWDDLCRKAGKTGPKPSGKPETVNHNKPPAHRIEALFTQGKRNYSKPIIANAIFSKHGLQRAIDECPELTALIDTILRLCRPGNP